MSKIHTKNLYQLMGLQKLLNKSLSNLFRPLKNFWAPVLSGIMIIFSHAPLSIFPMAFFCLVPLLVSLHREKPQRSFKKGFISGVVAYIGLIYWVTVAMNRYGGLDMFTSILIMLLLAFYMAVYVGVFCYVITILEVKYSLSILFSAPFVWVILEYIRGFFLTGFPWALIAYSQYNFLPLIQVVSITGVYFISFLIVAVNCVFYYIWSKKKAHLPYSLFVAALFFLSIVYGIIRLNEKTEYGDKKSVAIIQGNIPQNVKWDEGFKAKTVEKYINMTITHAGGSDLVVWPETSIPFGINIAKKIEAMLKSLANSLGNDLLFGTVHVEDGDKFYNSAYLINKNGLISGFYNKVHLVPFGEYTPLKEYIPFFEKITATGGNFAPGASHSPIKSSIGNIGVLICYEGIFPRISLETVRKNAHVLVNLTNDAWYDRTSAPFQHLVFYVFRAIETNRFILRAANTGISAIIDNKGRIRSKTLIFEDAVLKGAFFLLNNKTFYVRHGDWFIYIILGVFIFLIVWQKCVKSNRPCWFCGS